MNRPWKDRYELALEAARAAGRKALEMFDVPLNVEWKSNQTPVTIADREAEKLLREKLLSHFAGDGFLGEESGEVQGETGYRWIIDPIDGTRNFVRGIPLWGTLVGLEYRGETVAGACYIPAFDQMFHALRGSGAFRDNRRIHVSTIHDLPASQCFYSGVSWFVKSGCRDAFLDLVQNTQRQRGFGDFYGFVLVAQGSGEFMLEYGVNPWDIAALKPIIEEAGGKFTDWDGNPTIHRPDVLASNGLVHAEVLRRIRTQADHSFRPEVVEHAKDIT
ncbi:MAG: histidinol phosphate phosphatase [Gemmatales bacterium]|nr:histidinol phosphate phosphatase [Gemmatales bacterium]MDW8386174.1 inositol monophosphatase family protein [Gemmatales bacterium]